MQGKTRNRTAVKIPPSVKRYRAYELYKLRLLARDLTPEEYERRIKGYCRRHGI